MRKHRPPSCIRVFIKQTTVRNVPESHAMYACTGGSHDAQYNNMDRCADTDRLTWFSYRPLQWLDNNLISWKGFFISEIWSKPMIKVNEVVT
jgi:hypothetical protein